MKKVISLLMSFVMLFSITAGVDLSAYSYDVDHYLNFQADVYSSETAGFDNIFIGTDSSSFSRTLYNELKNDKKFQKSVALWSSTHIVDDPTYSIDNNVFQKKDLYDAILFDMIDSTEKSSLHQQYQNQFTKLYKMVKNERSSFVIKTADKILGKEKCTVEQLKTTKLSEDSKYLLLNGTKYAGVTSVVSDVDKILGNVKNAYDAINTVADYLAIKDINFGTSEILDEIKTDSQAPIALRTSAAEISDCMSGAYGKAAVLIVNGSISGVEFAFNKSMDLAWDSLLTCIGGAPALAVAFGAKTGRMLVNYFFKTETLIQGYYQLEAAVNVEDALIRAMKNKKNADTGYSDLDDAVYMKAVDMYKDIILLGFDYSIDLLTNAANSDFNTSTDFWLGNSSKCNELISEIQELKQKKIDNFVRYEEIVFEKYKSNFFPNYDKLEEEILKTVTVTDMSVTQLVDISVGDSGYFEDCFAYNYSPSNYTETTNVKVTSSNSNIISVVKDKDLKEKFVAVNTGTCTLTFTLNDRITCKRDVTVKAKTAGDLIKGECGENVKYSFDPSTGVLTIYGEGEMSVPHDHFDSIPNITSVVIKYGVTSIDYFSDCTNLTSVIIPNSVTNIGDFAFDNCSSLTNVTIPDSVTSIGAHAFCQCSSLTNVTIGNSVTRIGDEAFYNCSSLTNVIMGNSVTSIGYRAFDNCSSLTNVTIPDSVTSIDNYVFYQCSSLTNVTIGNSVISIGAGAFEGCSSLTNVTIPDSVTSIDNYVFYQCSSLTNVTIGNSVISIGAGAFEGCSSLTNVTIGNSVTSIGAGAFEKCSSLVSVTIPYNVTSIHSYAFEGCSNLTNVTMPNSVTSIGEHAFNRCTNLEKVFYNGTIAQWKSINVEKYNEYLTKSIIKCIDGVIGNGNIEKIGDYEYQLNNDYTVSIVKCLNKPDTIIIPANISYEGFKFNVTSIGANVFCDFSNLISVTIPDSVKSIGINAFKNCVSLTSVSMSNSLTSIGDSAFYRCTSLTNITIPNSVTSIGESAFCLCKSLTSLNIPNGVVSIEESAFDECIRLRKVYYNGTIAQWKSINFEYGNSYLAEAIIKCSDGVIGNRNIFTIDKIAYRLYNDSTASVDKYSNKSDETDTLIIPESILYEGFKFNITKIENSALSFCGNLTNVKIPNSVVSIGNYAFEGCANLTNVTISNKVTSIGNSAFNECSNLKKVFYNGTIAQWNSINFADGNLQLTEAIIKCTDGVIGNENVVTIDNVKYKIYNDNTATIVGYQNEPDVLVIPENIFYEGYKFRVTNIGYLAFGRCTKLTSVTISNGVVNIGKEAFTLCSNLTNVTIPNSVTSIGEYAFNSCKNVKISYNGTISQWKSISGSEDVLYIIKCSDGVIGNENIVTIDNIKYKLYNDYTATIVGYQNEPDALVIPKNIFYEGYKFRVINIGDFAFNNCANLTSVIIPDSIVNIGKESFNSCYNLSNVIIPDSVTSIGDSAFSICENLKDVYYTGTQDNWNKINGISSVNDNLVNATIHYNFVPCSENKHSAFGEWEIIKEATCTSDGLKKRVCAYDGYSETKKIDKINHNYKQNIVEPTCTTQGYTVYTCTECGNTYKGDYVATVEHSFKDYKYNNDATCTTDGTKTATCEYGCGTTDTVTAPNTAKGHKFVENEKYCINGCKTLNPNYKDPIPTPGGGSTGGGSTDPTPTPGGGGGGGAIPAPEPTPDDTDKKDDDKKPETKPSEPTNPSATKKPAAVKVNKLIANKKAIVVYWNKVNGVDGYHIQLATDKKFKKNRKSVIVAKQNASKKTVKKLKSKKKYFVRVRTYKTVNGKKIYGKWSKIKSVKIK